MKIESMTAPAINQLPTAKADAPQGISPRDRAIAALMGGKQAEQPIVQNASQVAPEEMTAVKAPTKSGTSDNTVETSESTAPAAESKVSEESISSQYALLARREKAIRQREQVLRAKEASTKAQELASKAPTTPAFDESKYVAKDRLTQDPFKVLGELGLTYDQLTELAMNAPRPEQLAMLNEIKALKDEMASLKGQTQKSFEEQQVQQRNEAIRQIGNEVRNLVRTDANYETVRATGNEAEVVALIEKVYDRDGILLSVEDATQEVEDYLVDEAIKLSKLNKIQRKLQPTPKAGEPKQTAQNEKQPMKTLTNSIASSKPLSSRDRAILAFENKLK